MQSESSRRKFWVTAITAMALDETGKDSSGNVGRAG
jgi:hypothetical protein